MLNEGNHMIDLLRKSVRIYQLVVGSIYGLYILSLIETSPTVGVVPYLIRTAPIAIQGLLILFVIAFVAIVRRNINLKLQSLVLTIIPQALYSFVAIIWWADTNYQLWQEAMIDGEIPRQLSFGALWTHPTITALLLLPIILIGSFYGIIAKGANDAPTDE